jgi:hypothetical protein
MISGFIIRQRQQREAERAQAAEKIAAATRARRRRLGRNANLPIANVIDVPTNVLAG